MKFVLLNTNSESKNIINRLELGNGKYINQLSFSKLKLEFMENKPKGFIKMLKYKLEDKKISTEIFKAIDNSDKKWLYITSKDFRENKYISCKLQGMLGYKLTATNELDSNISKYIEDYLKHNKELNMHELKLLIVANNSRDLNITVIENLIKQYKTVDIYINEKPSSYVLKKIKDINKNVGSTIEIIKNERKNFSEYNIIYFVNDLRCNYPRFRLNLEALVLDNNIAQNDKYNSNVIFLNEYINSYLKKDEKQLDNLKVEQILKEYKANELGTVVRKILEAT